MTRFTSQDGQDLQRRVTEAMRKPVSVIAYPVAVEPNLLIFSVEGEPIPKARARIVRGHAFTPKRTKDAEKRVKRAAVEAMIEKGWRVDAGASFRLEVYCNHKRKGRGDWDNYGKLVSDALNEVVFRDDRQVTEATVKRSRNCAKPCTIVHVRRIIE